MKLRDLKFDAAILHYTFLAHHWDAEALLTWKRAFDWVSKLDCLKVAIPQDEPDHCELLDEWLFDWKVDILFSVHFRPHRPLYPLTRRRAKVVNCLPGYIDEQTAARLKQGLLATKDRPVDVFYRARDLPFSFGQAGFLKSEVGRRFTKALARTPLTADISLRAEDVILGDAWFERLRLSKATIGTEGGYSAIDYRGELKARSALLVTSSSDVTFESFSEQMPVAWDDRKFFTITPRHFDAIITKTCQILVEGEYSGILKPNEHYIPLKRDFSNIDEVVTILHDTERLSSIADAAYNDVLLSERYGYRSFGNKVVDTIADALKQNRNSGIPRSENTIEVLEQQLVAERHRSELLEINLAHANKQVGELNYKLSDRPLTVSEYDQLVLDGAAKAKLVEAQMEQFTALSKQYDQLVVDWAVKANTIEAQMRRFAALSKRLSRPRTFLWAICIAWAALWFVTLLLLVWFWGHH